MKNILQEQNIERDNLAKFDPFGYIDRESEIYYNKRTILWQKYQTPKNS